MIPVYAPSLDGNERQYVLDCLESTWISSKGKYIAAFKDAFTAFTGIHYARPVCNGTVAIQVALAVLDIKAGDEVIVPSFTYVASVAPILQIGAKPVFIEVNQDTWSMEAPAVTEAITPKTKAIMVPHLYGNAVAMDKIMTVAKQHQLYVIEDCAESLGTLYQDQHTGAFGDISCFSFFGNKTITTGEGGMVATTNAALAQKVEKYCTQGLSANREYWHDSLGFNYRMTNIAAAIGLAQIERIGTILEEKIALAKAYQQALENTPLRWQTQTAGTRSSYWMVSATCRTGEERDALRQHLAKANIETRPLFQPVHLMPMFNETKLDFGVTETLAATGLNLPSWPGLSATERAHIFDAIQHFYH